MSGKFVYDVHQLISEKKAEKTALLTIEELFPFPEARLEELLRGLSPNSQVYWVQEENLNGGAYQFVASRIQRALSAVGWKGDLGYVGRRAVSATAVGSVELHKRETAELNEWIREIIV